MLNIYVLLLVYSWLICLANRELDIRSLGELYEKYSLFLLLTEKCRVLGASKNCMKDTAYLGMNEGGKMKKGGPAILRGTSDPLRNHMLFFCVSRSVWLIISHLSIHLMSVSTVNKVQYNRGKKFLFISLLKRGSDFRGYQTNCPKVWGYLMLGVPFPQCVLGVPLYLGVPKIFGGTSNLITHHVLLF